MVCLLPVHVVWLSFGRLLFFFFSSFFLSLAADMVVFNSHYNMESFLSKVNSHIRLSHLRMTSVRDKIGEKSHVLYFPLDFSQLSNPAADSDTAASSGADATCTGPPLLSSPLPSLDAGVVHKQTSDCNSTVRV